MSNGRFGFSPPSMWVLCKRQAVLTHKLANAAGEREGAEAVSLSYRQVEGVGGVVFAVEGKGVGLVSLVGLVCQ